MKAPRRVLLSVHGSAAEVTLNVSNEQLCSFKGSVEYRVCENNFETLLSDTIAVDLDSLSSRDVAQLDLGACLGSRQARRSRYLSVILRDAQGELLCETSWTVCRL